MQNSLPPLKNLRYFAAVARCLSFTQAASDLNVTQAAVSHQIKALEEYLEKPLFIRLPKQLLLTNEGQRLLPVVTHCFTELTNVIQHIKKPVQNTSLKVGLAPSFGAKWLVPRLNSFWQAYPNIELCLMHSNDVVDFRSSAIEMAIIWGQGNWPGVVAEQLISLEFFPVCSPSLLVGYPHKLIPEDIQHFALLHDYDHSGWAQWLEMVGVTISNQRTGIIIDDTNILIQAAIDGQGIAMGSSALVADHLASGRLVRPFEQILETDFSYYLTYPSEYLTRSAVQAFREWIIAEV